MLATVAQLASARYTSLADPTQPAGDWIMAPPLSMWSPTLGWDASGTRLLALGRSTGEWTGLSLWAWPGSGNWERLLAAGQAVGGSNAAKAFDPTRHCFYVIPVPGGRDAATRCWTMTTTPVAEVREFGNGLPGAHQPYHLFVDVHADRLIAVTCPTSWPALPYAIWARSLADSGQWRKVRDLPDRGYSGMLEHMALDARRSRLLWQKTLDPTRQVTVDSTLALPIDTPGDWEVLSARATPRPRSAAVLLDSLMDRLVVVSKPASASAPFTSHVEALDLGGAGGWSVLPDLPRDAQFRGLATSPDASDLWVFGNLPGAEVHRLRSQPGASWEAVNPALGIPATRLDLPPMIADPLRHRVVYLGTATGQAPPDSAARIAVWTMSTEKPEGWTRIEPAGEAPRLLSGATFVLDPFRRRGLLFGGRLRGGGLSADVWALSLDDTPRWEKLAAGPGPSARWLSAAVFDPSADRMIVIGGRDDAGALPDVWELGFQSAPAWVARPVRGASGLDFAATQPAFRNPANGAIHIVPPVSGSQFAVLLPGDTAAWVSRGSLRANSTFCTWGCAATYDPIGRRGFAHGGFNGFESWTGNTDVGGLSDSSTWTALYPTGQKAPARALHPVAYDGIGDQMIIGCALADYGDTWFLRFDRPERAAPWAIAADGAGVHLDWFAKGPPGLAFLVQRRTPTEPWTTLGARTASGEHVTWSDAAVRTGERYGYRLAWPSGGDTLWCEESWTYGPAATGAVALAGAWPNPSRGQTVTLAFTLADASAARLELFDVTGRRVWSRTTAGVVGRQLATIDASLRPGVYLARVAQGARRATARIVVVK